jgi:hypothetical protein
MLKLNKTIGTLKVKEIGRKTNGLNKITKIKQT